jgi:hypothetical protein
MERISAFLAASMAKRSKRSVSIRSQPETSGPADRISRSIANAVRRDPDIVNRALAMRANKDVGIADLVTDKEMERGTVLAQFEHILDIGGDGGPELTASENEILSQHRSLNIFKDPKDLILTMVVASLASTTQGRLQTGNGNLGKFLDSSQRIFPDH